MHIIGISGKKRSGKDTLAEFLQDHGYEKYSFADNIKRACEEIFGFTEEQLWGDKKEHLDTYWGITPRYAMQFIGTDMFRDEFGEDVWVRSLFRDLNMENPDWVVIPDVRFPNEVEAIQEGGGIVVRVDASERLDNNDTHASETALDGYEGFDYVIYNNGTLEEYEENIEEFMWEFLEQTT